MIELGAAVLTSRCSGTHITIELGGAVLTSRCSGTGVTIELGGAVLTSRCSGTRVTIDGLDAARYSPVDVMVLVYAVEFQLEAGEQVLDHDPQHVVQDPGGEADQVMSRRLQLKTQRVQQRVHPLGLQEKDGSQCVGSDGDRPLEPNVNHCKPELNIFPVRVGAHVT